MERIQTVLREAYRCSTRFWDENTIAGSSRYIAVKVTNTGDLGWHIRMHPVELWKSWDAECKCCIEASFNSSEELRNWLICGMTDIYKELFEEIASEYRALREITDDFGGDARVRE